VSARAFEGVGAGVVVAESVGLAGDVEDDAAVQEPVVRPPGVSGDSVC
jgi:hypothetical protein